MKTFYLIKNFVMANTYSPFEVLSDTSVANDDIATSIAASIMQILFMVGMAGAIISSIIQIIITVFANKKGEKWAELKTNIGNKLWIIIALSCITTVFSFIKMIAESLVE